MIENLPGIAVLLVLSAIVALIVIGMVRSKKRGGSSCGCGCSDCPMKGKCHTEKTDEKQ